MPAASFFLRASALALVLAHAAVVPSLLAQPLPDGPRLRDLADARGVLVGAALGDGFSSAEMGAATYAAYAAVAGREFNLFTSENAHKFGRIHPNPTTYDFPVADRYDAFARSVGGLFHGHVFIWYKSTSTPAFVVDTTTREGLLALLHGHIDAVGARYGPGTILWDVVNEALQSNVPAAPVDWRDALRDPATDHWHNVIGTDYIELAFHRAAAVRAAHGHACKLIYNDYANETLSPKAEAQYLMARDFLARGVPLEGIGFQMHVGTGAPGYSAMRSNFKRLSDLGLDLYITEFDTITGSSAAELDRQAAIYHRSLDVALRNPHFRGFQTWGFTDRSSWLYDWEGNPLGADVRPLLFTADFVAKPAYYAVQDALAYEDRDPLLLNGGFETDSAPWFALAASGEIPPSLGLTAERPHSGASALAVRDRASPASVIAQDVLPRLAASQGGAGRYHLSGWFRTLSDPVNARLTLRIADNTGATRDFSVSGLVGASWTRLSGWINVTWNRSLVSAILLAETTGSASGFDLDDVALGDGNLLANSTAEDDLASWTILGTPALASETAQARRHYGDRGLRASARAAAWQGPAQDVRAALLAAGPGSYQLSGYLKTDAVEPRVGKLTVRLTRAGVHTHHSVTRDITAASWTRLSGELSLAWDSPPDAALLYAETSAGTEPLGLDDVILRKTAAPPVTSFDAWRALHFTESELNDGTRSSATATPAGDGVANLLKYALGLPPRLPVGSGDLPRLHVAADGDRSLRLERASPAPSEIAIDVETSSDLQTWTRLVLSPVISLDPASAREFVDFPLPTPAAAASFYRLRFTLP